MSNDAAPSGGVARRGTPLVLSAPSGAGKTTLAKRLLAETPNLALSISATTRPMREGEEDGRDYHFKSRAAFESEIAGDAFLEHAEVFGNLYGTPKGPVAAWLDQGRDVLFDIDWQGAAQLRAGLGRAGDAVASVFILPPDMATLEQRLRGRRKDSDETIARRLAKAGSEIAHARDYDYVIVNDDLDVSAMTLHAILAAERARRARMSGLPSLIDALVRDADAR